MSAVELYWIPLGAGGHCVRRNGKVFEAVAAALGRRRRCDLYHAALILRSGGRVHTIELAPSGRDGILRGVVATGPVGSRWAGRLRLFRYELRCWRGGSIPDLAYAVGDPWLVSSDPRVARRILALMPMVPVPVWGRDELHAGEMWNSNSVIAWLLTAAGVPVDDLCPPPGGRAPGWGAGLVVARRASPAATRPRRARRARTGRRPADGGGRSRRRGSRRRAAAPPWRRAPAKVNPGRSINAIRSGPPTTSDAPCSRTAT
jgi:hypothetical protein